MQNKDLFSRKKDCYISKKVGCFVLLFHVGLQPAMRKLPLSWLSLDVLHATPEIKCKQAFRGPSWLSAYRKTDSHFKNLRQRGPCRYKRH